MPLRIIPLLSVLILAAVPAHALDVGACDTPENLSASLRAEGHKIVASMDMVGISLREGGKVGYDAELITATPDLKRWYAIKGDRPLGEKSTRLCIAAKGRNLEINDYRRNGEPTVTRYRFDRAAALAQCDEIAEQIIDGVEKGISCNELNAGLRILEEDTGGRIALQGESDRGVLVTIIADPANENDYRVLITASKGATGIARSGVRFGFSDWVRSVLDRQVR